MKNFAALLAAALALALVSPPPAAALPPLPTAAQAGFSSCCPPWNATQLQSMLFYQGSGGIGAPYTLKFNPTPLLHSQLNAYFNYLQTLGMGFTSILINFQLVDAGTGAAPSPGVLISQQPVNWTGTGTPTPTLFPNNLMVVNHWYRIQTQLILGGNPDSGFLPRECVTSYVDVRIQLIPGPRSRVAAATLQFRLADGRVVERAVSR